MLQGMHCHVKASGLKLRHFGGGYSRVWGGRKVQAVPIGEQECVIVRSCPPQVQDSWSVLGAGVFKVYSGMGERELLSSTCCVLLGCLQ